MFITRFIYAHYAADATQSDAMRRHAERFLCKTESFSRSASHDSLDRVIFAKITSAALFSPSPPTAVRFSRCKLQLQRTRAEYINRRTFYATSSKVKYMMLKHV